MLLEGYLFKIGQNTILQKSVALSTTVAEYYALCEAVKETIWLRGSNTTIIHKDNQATIEFWAHNLKKLP
jgi:hypothetical protein